MSLKFQIIDVSSIQKVYDAGQEVYDKCSDGCLGEKSIINDKVLNEDSKKGTMIVLKKLMETAMSSMLVGKKVINPLQDEGSEDSNVSESNIVAITSANHPIFGELMEATDADIDLLRILYGMKLSTNGPKKQMCVNGLCGFLDFGPKHLVEAMDENPRTKRKSVNVFCAWLLNRYDIRIVKDPKVVPEKAPVVKEVKKRRIADTIDDIIEINLESCNDSLNKVHEAVNSCVEEVVKKSKLDPKTKGQVYTLQSETDDCFKEAHRVLKENLMKLASIIPSSVN